MDAMSGRVLVIQYNWEESRRNNENTWIYYKKLNEKSLHGNIGDGTFDIIFQSAYSILIHHVLSTTKTLFVSPVIAFSSIHAKSVISLDVGNNGLGVSASTDNKLHVWQSEDGVVRRLLEGHLFDVYSCRLFPSGVVVLSGGADMQMKIWDVATGICPVTLKGHTASITAMSIVERGKNIISVSKDGTARLWNCAQAQELETLIKVGSEINCCDIIDDRGTLELTYTEEMAGELEFGTKGKLLALGCEDGKVYVLNVHSRDVLIAHFVSSPVSSICWLASLRLVIGLEDGRIMELDAKKLSELPQQLSHDTSSGVLCLKPLLSGFLVGRQNGLCQFYSLDGASPVQLTGQDCDPIYDIAVDLDFVYTASRDAVIRKYRISDMKLKEF